MASWGARTPARRHHQRHPILRRSRLVDRRVKERCGHAARIADGVALAAVRRGLERRAALRAAAALRPVARRRRHRRDLLVQVEVVNIRAGRRPRRLVALAAGLQAAKVVRVDLVVRRVEEVRDVVRAVDAVRLFPLRGRGRRDESARRSICRAAIYGRPTTRGRQREPMRAWRSPMRGRPSSARSSSRAGTAPALRTHGG